jgi:hypothetical protein
LGVQDVGLRPGITYTYTLAATQIDGRVGSASTTFTTPNVQSVTGLTGTDKGAGTVSLAWQAVPLATYYVVFGPGSAAGGTKVSGLTYTVTGAPPGAQTWSIATYYDPGPTSATVPVSPNAVSTGPTTSVTVNVAGAVVSTAKMTGFDPDKHGFRFINDFSNSFIGPPVSMTTGGLCGGMTYAVLDFFLLKRDVPETDVRPANGTSFQQYLYDRQVKSLVENIDKWVETSFNPGGARSLEFFNWGLTTRLQELASFIDRGVPVPLGMKGPTGGIGGDHQVLAIGYDLGRYKGDLGAYKDEVKIFIFDPNYLNRVKTLIADPATLEYRYLEGGTERWRTYFVDGKYTMTYPTSSWRTFYPTDGLVHEVQFAFTTGADDMRGGADHVNLKIRMADGSVVDVQDASSGGRYLPNYTETIRITLSNAVAQASIKSIEISTNGTGGLNGDNWDMARLQLYAVGSDFKRALLTTPAGPYRFAGVNPSLNVIVQ